MSTRRLRTVLGGLILLTLALAGARSLLPTKAVAAVDCVRIATQSADRDSHVDGRPGAPVVAVLGDSYAQGYGLNDQTDSWPKAFAADYRARVMTFSLGGTGFATAPCAVEDTYPHRARAVPAEAKLVVIEGGLNDVLVPDAVLRRGVEQTVTKIGASRSVVVGPVAAPKWKAQAKHVDQVLAKACADLGVRYISAYSWPVKFGPDQIHMASPADHDVFARGVADALR